MTDTTQQRDRLLAADSATRKTYPMFSGLLAYFPDALAYVAWVSHQGNEKHNPGEPMHHARGKSTDHADCIARHLTRHGQFDGDVRESGALAWRALALLQEELEQAHGLPLPRGARGEEPKSMMDVIREAYKEFPDCFSLGGAKPKTEGGAPVVPSPGGYMKVEQQPGESMSEAICRTTREAHGLERLKAATEQRLRHNADPNTRHGGIPLESRHGFTVGEIVETTYGQRGPVVGFDGEFVLVNAGNYTRGGWFPHNLRRSRTEPLT